MEIDILNNEKWTRKTLEDQQKLCLTINLSDMWSVFAVMKGSFSLSNPSPHQ